MDALPTEVGSVIVQVISEAYDIYKRYQDRDAEQAEFGKFMRHVATILEGVKGSVPQRARPVACDLAALVGIGNAKSAKYKSRGLASTLLHLHSERERREGIMRGVQQLLPLLTLSVASATDVSTAVADLGRRAVSLQGSSAEAAEHLRHLRAAVEAVRASPGTTSAATVEDSIAVLAQSMQRMHTDSLEAVLKEYEAMQVKLGADFEKVVESVTDLQGAVGSLQDSQSQLSEQMLSEHTQLAGEVQGLKELLSVALSSGTVSAVSAVTQTTVQFPDDDDAGSLDSDGDGARSRTSVSSFRTCNSGRKRATTGINAAAAVSLRAAVASVADQLFLTTCPLWGLPFTPEGPMRPVRLSCCRLIISDAACAALRTTSECKFCRSKKRLGRDWGSPFACGPTFQAMTRASLGVSLVRAVLISEVLLADASQTGTLTGSEESNVRNRDHSFGDVTWEAGAVRQAVVRGTPTTVKGVHIGYTDTTARVIWVREILSVTDTAAKGSPHVCKLLGFCWTDSELWLLMRRCEGSLADYVRKVQSDSGLAGLPPLDVVNLGLSMCCALRALHERLRVMHLDVTPHSILLKRARTHSSVGSRLWIALLSDFCLADRLHGTSKRAVHRRDLNWRSPTESMTGSRAKGTVGYAPPEQIARRGEARSDVYTLGMTLLYAATGAHPDPDHTMEGSVSGVDACLDGRRQTGVVERGCDAPDPRAARVAPARLLSLLQRMTACDVRDRPAAAEVQRELRTIHSALTAEGATPRHISSAEDDTIGAHTRCSGRPETVHHGNANKAEPCAGSELEAVRTASAAGPASTRTTSIFMRGKHKLRLGRRASRTAQADVRTPQADAVHVQKPSASTEQAQQGREVQLAQRPQQAQQASSALSVDDWVNQQAHDVAGGALMLDRMPDTPAGAHETAAASVKATADETGLGEAAARGSESAAAPKGKRTSTASAIRKLFRRYKRGQAAAVEQAAADPEDPRPAEADESRVQQPAPKQWRWQAPAVASERQPKAEFKRTVYGRFTVADLLQLLSESASVPHQVFDCGGATLHLMSDWKEEADALVVRGKGDDSQRRAQLCRGAGTVSNVTLELGERGMLVLHGTVDVEFRASKIRGGSLNGTGPRCKVKLTDVILEGCLLNLRDRVTVNMTQTQSTSSGVHHAPTEAELSSGCSCPLPAVPRYAIAMRGAGTTVRAADVWLDRGVRVFDGAKFTGTAVHVTLAGHGQHCVTAQGEGARVELIQSGLTVDSDERAAEDRCGLIADAGASVSMSQTPVSRVSRGARVQTGAHLQMNDCMVSAVVQGVLIVGAGSAAEVVGGRIRGGEMAIGVDTAAQLTLRECDVGRVVPLEPTAAPLANGTGKQRASAAAPHHEAVD